MAEFPALPLWTDAYLADTTHLSPTEHGVYLLLLMIAWRTPGCELPDDDALLMKYSRTRPEQWKKLRPVIAQFFEITDGKWRQRRLTAEFAYVREVHEKRVQNGSMGGKKAALSRSKKPERRSDSERRSPPSEDRGSKVKLLKTDEPPLAGLSPSYQPNGSTHTHTQESVSIAGAIQTDRARETDTENWDQVALGDALCRIGGVRNLEPNRISANARQAQEWIDEKFPIPIIERTIAQIRDQSDKAISSLKYFDKAIRQAVAKEDHPHERSFNPSEIRDPILRNFVQNNGRIIV